MFSLTTPMIAGTRLAHLGVSACGGRGQRGGRRRYRPVMHDEPENDDYAVEVRRLLEHAVRDELTVYSGVLELGLPGFTPGQGDSCPLAKCMSTR